MNIWEIITYGFTPLIVSLLIVWIVPMTLRAFQGLYLLIAAGNIMLAYLSGNILPIVVSLICGEILLILMAGIYGKKLSPDVYASIVCAIAFFPWYISYSNTLLYVMFSYLSLTIFSTVKRGIIRNKMGFTKTSLKDAPKETRKEFRRRAAVIPAVPQLIAVAATIALFVVL